MICEMPGSMMRFRDSRFGRAIWRLRAGVSHDDDVRGVVSDMLDAGTLLTAAVLNGIDFLGITMFKDDVQALNTAHYVSLPGHGVACKAKVLNCTTAAENNSRRELGRDSWRRAVW